MIDLKNYTPTDGRILLKLDDSDTKTAEGIVIAHSAGEKTESVAIKAKVVKVGELMKNYDIEVGDTVYVSKWETSQLKIEGETFLICKDEEVVLIVKNAEKKK